MHQNKYNPDIHSRRSVRLKGFDYSQEGLYFVTICCKERECFFGNIAGEKMILNDTGRIAGEFWLEIPKHFANVVLHEHIVMPNHVHGIIELVSPPQIADIPVGTSHIVGTSHVMSLQYVMSLQQKQKQKQKQTNQNQFSKSIPGSVSVIIQQYKSSVKRWCNKNNHGYFLWQSRFHDHIIRDEQSYQTISEYITNNPVKWNEDHLF